MFCIDSNDDIVIEAVKHVVTLFEDDRFWNRAKVGAPFEMSDGAPRATVVEFIRQYPRNKYDIIVGTFRYYNPWSKMLARFRSKYPDRVELNAWKLNRSVESIAGSIVHEIVHLVDHKYMHFSFGHGNNSKKGKEYTAPYWLGREAKQFIKENYL